MTAKPKQEDAVSVLCTKWEEIGRKVAQLAADFPEEKFEHRPVEGVRTFGEVLRHLAFWDQYVADSLNGKKADDSSNELPLVDYPTKARIVAALKRNSQQVGAVLEKHSSRDMKTVELVMTFLEHTCEHYGQLVVYSRLGGIVPASSR